MLRHKELGKSARVQPAALLLFWPMVKREVAGELLVSGGHVAMKHKLMAL